MRRWITMACVAIGLSACGSPTASQVGSPLPSSGSGTLVIECLGSLEQGTCDSAVRVVLDTVAPSGWTPTHVWVNSGTLGPTEEILFDPNATFPALNLPEGSTALGNAEVAFAGTDKHAGMNLAAVGSDIVPTLIGYVVPHPEWCSGTCPSTASTDGPFRLELVLSRLDWKAGEPIHGTAILSFDGPAPTTIYGSGSVLNFAYAEVGGTREVEPVWTADCATHTLDPATPISEPLGKSGAASEGDPATAWLHSFILAPDVRLPAGSWDVTALAIFTDGEMCDGPSHSMETTLRVTVSD